MPRSGDGGDPASSEGHGASGASGPSCGGASSSATLEALQNGIFHEMISYHPEVTGWTWGADWAALDAQAARTLQQAAASGSAPMYPALDY